MDNLYDDIYQTLDEVNQHIPHNSPPPHGDPPPPPHGNPPSPPHVNPPPPSSSPPPSPSSPPPSPVVGIDEQ